MKVVSIQTFQSLHIYFRFAAATIRLQYACITGVIVTQLFAWRTMPAMLSVPLVADHRAV